MMDLALYQLLNYCHFLAVAVDGVVGMVTELVADMVNVDPQAIEPKELVVVWPPMTMQVNLCLAMDLVVVDLLASAHYSEMYGPGYETALAVDMGSAETVADTANLVDDMVIDAVVVWYMESFVFVDKANVDSVYLDSLMNYIQILEILVVYTDHTYLVEEKLMSTPEFLMPRNPMDYSYLLRHREKCRLVQVSIHLEKRQMSKYAAMDIVDTEKLSPVDYNFYQDYF